MPAQPFRVIYLTPHDHGNPVGGGGVYSRSVCRVLAQARPDWKIEVVAPESVPRTLSAHRWRQIESVGAALLRGISAQVWFGNHPSLRARLGRALAAGLPDLLVLDSPDMALPARAVPASVPRLLIGHNVEHRLFEARVAALPLPARLLARGLLGEPGRYRRFEAAVWREARAIVQISAEEAGDYPAGTPQFVLPPVFAGRPAAGRARGAGLRVGFVGKMTWWPNREGIEWFLSRVWPQVAPPAELHLFGIGSEALSAPARRVFGHGFVPDAAAVWTGMDVMIVPMFSGGGVNVKLCEALWQGLPCLATPVALRGLPDLADPALRVSADPAAWTAALAGTGEGALAAAMPSAATRQRFDEAAAAGRMAAWLDGTGLGAPASAG